jgi:hypothetical protein
MASKPRKVTAAQGARMMADMHREQREREKGYRERALKLFPHVCASCGREFDGKRLKELTVHHKNHDHNHNPPDGSNWELLCLYCHDHEHEKHKMKGYGNFPSHDPNLPPIANPFDSLDSLLPPKNDPPPQTTP